MNVQRLWRRSVVRGAAQTAKFARDGARVHPTARLDAVAGAIGMGPGAAVSERCVLEASGRGRIVLGAGVWLAHDCELATDTAGGITVGARTTIQRRCSINGTVHIGADSILAPNVFISSGAHPFDEWPHLPIREQERRLADTGDLPDRPVVIGDDCWIGVNVAIAPGCTIGKGAVVGANSVVTHDVGPYEVVAGIPARTLRHRLDWQPPADLDATSEQAIPYLLRGFDLTYGSTLEARFEQALVAVEAGDVIVTVDDAAGRREFEATADEDGLSLTGSPGTRLISVVRSEHA